MNRRPIQSRPEVAADPASYTQRQLADWRRLLGECSRKPTRKRVHLLRVATLRLQSQYRSLFGQPPLGEFGADHPAAKAAKRWNKQVKQLRGALGDVRVFDVHFASLAKVRGLLTTTSGYQPRSSRISLRQIDVLEKRFKRRRRTAADDLVEMLKVRYERIEAAAAQLASAVGTHQLPLEAWPSPRLLERFAEAVTEFPALTVDTLHDFRKEIKNVRYLAELIGPSDEAHAVAAAAKEMQGAIGTWHDLDQLAREAARAGRRAHQEGLTDLLETLAEEALEKALHVCSACIARLLPDASRSGQRQALQSKPAGNKIAPTQAPRKSVQAVTAHPVSSGTASRRSA
jgi:CHAD domain-containing protein